MSQIKAIDKMSSDELVQYAAVKLDQADVNESDQEIVEKKTRLARTALLLAQTKMLQKQLGLE